MSGRGSEERLGAGNRAQPTGLPRWVKVFLIVAVALALLAVGVALVVGGEHGPGRHQARSTTTGAAPPRTPQLYAVSGLT
jgi:flagellar basal body-associated protein FliL